MVWQATMSEQEAQEIIENKTSRELLELEHRALQDLCTRIIDVIEEVGENFIIKDEDAAAELLAMAAMYRD